MKSLLDPSFRYTNSASTDIRKTFARVRREQRELASAKAEQDAREANNITTITTKRKAAK